MHKRARGLDQSLEKIVIGRLAVEPELLQHIVRFVVALLIPATKIGAIKGAIRYVATKIDIVALKVAHELRNPLAFAHVGLNLPELR